MKCTISKLTQRTDGMWTFTYIDEEGNTQHVEDADKEQCAILRDELIDAFKHDSDYKAGISDGALMVFERVPKAKAKFNSLPSEDDPDFFLKILRRFARKIAIDPSSRELINAAGAIARIATAARGWQDYANLIEDMSEFKNFMQNYYKAQRVGSSVVRSPQGDAEISRVH